MKTFTDLLVKESWTRYNGVLTCLATDPDGPSENRLVVNIVGDPAGLNSEDERTYNVYDFSSTTNEDFYVIEAETCREVLVDDFLEKIKTLPLLGTVQESSLHHSG